MKGNRRKLRTARQNEKHLFERCRTRTRFVLGLSTRRRRRRAGGRLDRVGERRESPPPAGTYQMKRIDAAVTEAVPDVEVVGRPERREVAADLHAGIPH